MAARVARIVKKAASIGALVVLTVGAGAAARWLGMRPDRSVEQFRAGPGAVERLAEQARRGEAGTEGGRKPPLIQQAEAFAAYLNPPVQAKPVAARPALVRPRPMRPEAMLPPPPPVRLLGISYHRSDPAESRALVLDPQGCRWLRQGARSGELVIEQIKPRSILCRGKEGMQEMTMETEAGPVVPVQNMPVPLPAGRPADQAPALAQSDMPPGEMEEAQPVEMDSGATPAPKIAVVPIAPSTREPQESRPSPGRRPRPVRPVARKG